MSRPVRLSPDEVVRGLIQCAVEHEDEAERIEREMADLPWRVARDAACEREHAGFCRAAAAMLQQDAPAREPMTEGESNDAA